jgi:two-component system, chemotaxis family, CheB/CheR fusion protein
MQGLSLPHLHVFHLPANLFSPCNGEDPLDEHAFPVQATAADKHQAHVLVVDDAPDVLEMFSMMLRLSGYEVSVAASAPEALEQVSAVQFDIIVSDIGMPEMNGYELARRVRELPGYTNVPMIAVTGFVMYKDQAQALESGFNAHLSKPVNPTTLIDLIERLRE